MQLPSKGRTVSRTGAGRLKAPRADTVISGRLSTSHSAPAVTTANSSNSLGRTSMSTSSPGASVAPRPQGSEAAMKNK